MTSRYDSRVSSFRSRMVIEGKGLVVDLQLQSADGGATQC